VQGLVLGYEIKKKLLNFKNSLFTAFFLKKLGDVKILLSILRTIQQLCEFEKFQSFKKAKPRREQKNDDVFWSFLGQSWANTGRSVAWS